MKLKTHFFFICCLCIITVHCGFSQQQKLQQTLSFSLQHATPIEALQIIDSLLPELNLSYNPGSLITSTEIHKSFVNESVENILTEILHPLKLDFKLIEKQLVVIPLTLVTNWYTVSGYVKSKTNEEALIGATIFSPEISEGIISNAYGFFSIRLPDNITSIYAQYLGYKSRIQPISLTSNQRFDFYLTPDTSLINPVFIYSGNTPAIHQAQTGYHKLKPTKVIQMSSVMGEDDIIKSLDFIPGIKMVADGSVNYHVRGGGRDQNLLLIDDAPVYNPSHLFGLYSTVIPGAINNIDIYKADIPVQYGGRLSSLLDIRIKDGNKSHFSGSGSISPISTNISLEGPLVNHTNSFFIWSRRSHIKGYATRYYDRDITNFGFYDFYGKLNIKLNTNNRLFASVYNGGDKYLASNTTAGKSGLQWGNSLFNLRWNSIVHQKLFVNTTFIISNYRYFQHQNTATNTHLVSSINNAQLKSDFTWFNTTQFTSRFGLFVGLSAFNPGNFYTNDQEMEDQYPVVPRHFTTEQHIYYSLNHKVNEQLTLNYGIRLNLWNNHGEANIFEYDENYQPTDTIYVARAATIYNNYKHVLPRISVNYKIWGNLALRASASVTAQNVHLISNTTSPFTTLDLWLPANKIIQPQRSYNLIGGVQYNFKEGNYTLLVETYYRKLLNQLDYEYYAEIFLNPHLEAELRFGEAVAKGVEIQLSKNYGKLSGWVNASVNRVHKYFETVNNGNSFPATYDQPFSASLFASYQWTDRFFISGSFLIASGNTFSAPSGFYNYQGYQVPLYNDKNNARLQTYHRADLSATWQLNKQERAFSHLLKFSMYNTYGNKNPFSVNYNKARFRDNNILVPADRSVNTALIITESYVLSWFPSVTYSFKWK